MRRYAFDEAGICSTANMSDQLVEIADLGSISRVMTDRRTV